MKRTQQSSVCVVIFLHLRHVDNLFTHLRSPRYPQGLPKTSTTTCVHLTMPALPSITASPTGSAQHSAQHSQCASPNRQLMISTSIHNVDLDLVREKVTSMTHSEKILRIVTFTAQYTCFPAVTCVGINQKCGKCQKRHYSRWSWIFEPSQFKEKAQVSVRKCQIKAGKLFFH